MNEEERTKFLKWISLGWRAWRQGNPSAGPTWKIAQEIYERAIFNGRIPTCLERHQLENLRDAIVGKVAP